MITAAHEISCNSEVAVEKRQRSEDRSATRSLQFSTFHSIPVHTYVRSHRKIDGRLRWLCDICLVDGWTPFHMRILHDGIQNSSIRCIFLICNLLVGVHVSEVLFLCVLRAFFYTLHARLSMVQSPNKYNVISTASD